MMAWFERNERRAVVILCDVCVCWASITMPPRQHNMTCIYTLLITLIHLVATDYSACYMCPLSHHPWLYNICVRVIHVRVLSLVRSLRMGERDVELGTRQLWMIACVFQWSNNPRVTSHTSLLPLFLCSQEANLAQRMINVKWTQ